MNKPSLSAITDTAVKITTALVIAKYLYINWAFNWNIFSTPWLCVAEISLLIFFTSLALQTRRIYPQAILGLSWLLVFPWFSIFAARISFIDYSLEHYLAGTCLLSLSAPVMLNILHHGKGDIETIRRSRFDFRTPRRDALFPYFCQIGLFCTFATIIYPWGYRKPWFNLFFCLLLMAILSPLPAAFVRRLKARRAVGQSPQDTPQESPNNETSVADKPVRHIFWHKSQFYLRLAIVILSIIFIFSPAKLIIKGITKIYMQEDMANALLYVCVISLIPGIIEEFILLYRLKKEVPWAITRAPAVARTSDNSSAAAIPASVNSINRVTSQNFTAQTSKAPLLRVQQSQSQKQKNARAINALLQGLGIIILLILFVFLTLDVHYSSGGNINTYDRRF